MKTHLVDNAFHILADKAVDIEHKNYLQLNLDKIDISHFTLPEKYIIITTGHTVKVREMTPAATNGVIDYVIKKGYTPVFLGSKVATVGVAGKQIDGNFNNSINYHLGLDLIDKTSLLEAGKIIAGSKAVVGLDNGLQHLAGMTQVPIVAAYTTVEAKYRLPYRNNTLGWNCYPIEPPESLACRGCQSRWDVYEIDFRHCHYVTMKLDNKIQCVDSIKAENYIEQLEKIL